MLNKWVRMREEGNAPARRNNKRPVIASQCEHLADAERFRNQIVREIAAGISKIQNPALGEHSIRDLNDSINKLMREKYHWNKRIRELGGLDFNAIEKQRRIEERGLGGAGNDVLVADGYTYFGAAKDLPGVRELFEKRQQKEQARKRGDIVKNIRPEYYGWRDEEDGVLLELEGAAAAASTASEGGQRHHKRRKVMATEARDAGVEDLSGGGAVDYLEDIPTQDEIDKVLLEEKKRALLAKFSF